MTDPDAIQSRSSSWRVGRSAARAALAGAWAALCLSLPRLGYALLDEPVRSQALALMDMTGLALARHLSLSGLAPWLTLALTAFIAAGVLALVWQLVLRWLDRDMSARAALRWSLRTLPMLVLWSIGLVVVLGTAALVSDHLLLEGLPSGYAWSVMLLPLPYLLSLPLFCLRRELVGRASPPLVWRPGWPGWPVIATTVAICFLTVMAMHAEAALVSAQPALAWPAAVADWLLQSVLLTIVLLLWLRRSRWRRLPADAGDALRWIRLRRTLAVQWLGYGLIFLLLAPPLLAIALDATSFMPTIASISDTHQLARPSALTIWAGFADWVTQYWWVVLGLLIPWFGLSACARSLLQVEDAPAE